MPGRPMGRPGGVGMRRGPGGVPDLQPGHGRDPNQPRTTQLGPVGRVRAVTEPDQRRLIDQPIAQSHAPPITDGSARSANAAAKPRRSWTETGKPVTGASCVNRRQMYSLCDMPNRAPSAASASSGMSRINPSMLDPPPRYRSSVAPHRARPRHIRPEPPITACRDAAIMIAASGSGTIVTLGLLEAFAFRGAVCGAKRRQTVILTSTGVAENAGKVGHRVARPLRAQAGLLSRASQVRILPEAPKNPGNLASYPSTAWSICPI